MRTALTLIAALAALTTAHAAPLHHRHTAAHHRPLCHVRRHEAACTIASTADARQGLRRWATATMCDHSQPRYVREAASRALTHPEEFAARLTVFQPRIPGVRHIDRQGGGSSPAWSALRRRLRDGDCAAWPGLPFGTLVWCAGRLLVVADRGPGVQGHGRLDVCVTDPGAYRKADVLNVRRCPAWIVGHITAKDAR